MWFNLQTCRVKIWLVVLFFAIVIIIGGVLAYRNHQNNVKRAEQILIQKRTERESLRSGLRDLEGTINNLHSRHRPNNLHDVERDLMRRTRSVDPFSPTKDAEKKETDGKAVEGGEKCNMCVSCEKRDISVKALPNHDVCAFCKRLNEICSEPTEKAEMQEKLDQILTTAKDNQAKIGGLSFEETEKAILAKLDRILNNQKIDSDSDSGRDSDTDSDEEPNKSKKRKVDSDEFAQIASPQSNKRRLDSGDEDGDGAAKRKKSDEPAACEPSAPSTASTASTTVATSVSPTTTTPAVGAPTTTTPSVGASTTAPAPTTTTPSVGASTTAPAPTTTTPSVDASTTASAPTTTTPSVDAVPSSPTGSASTTPPAAASEATATTSSAAPPVSVSTITTPATVTDAAACATMPAQTNAANTQPVPSDDATTEKKTVK